MTDFGPPWTLSRTSNSLKICGARALLRGRSGRRIRKKQAPPKLILFVSLHALFKLALRPGGSPQHSLFRGPLGRYRDWFGGGGPFFGPQLCECVARLG